MIQLPLKTWETANFNFILKFLWTSKQVVCREIQKPWILSTLDPCRILIFNFRSPMFISPSSLEYALVPCQISRLYLNKQEHSSCSKLAVFQCDSPGPAKNGKNRANWPNDFLRLPGRPAWLRFSLGWVRFLLGWRREIPWNQTQLGTFLHHFHTFLPISRKLLGRFGRYQYCCTRHCKGYSGNTNLHTCENVWKLIPSDNLEGQRPSISQNFEELKFLWKRHPHVSYNLVSYSLAATTAVDPDNIVLEKHKALISRLFVGCS